MQDYQNITQRIREALWPAGKQDHAWSPDTLDAIADILARAGLGPELAVDDLPDSAINKANLGNPNTHWLVRWEIDIYSNSPRETAEEAYRHMHAPGTTATVFEVIDSTGKATLVDLRDGA